MLPIGFYHILNIVKERLFLNINIQIKWKIVHLTPGSIRAIISTLFLHCYDIFTVIRVQMSWATSGQWITAKMISTEMPSEGNLWGNTVADCYIKYVAIFPKGPNPKSLMQSHSVTLLFVKIYWH